MNELPVGVVGWRWQGQATTLEVFSVKGRKEQGNRSAVRG